MFFKRKKPTIDSFRWDNAGWQPQTAKNGYVWVNEMGDVATQMFGEGSAGLPMRWRDSNVMRDHARTNPLRGMSIVSTDIVEASGVAYVQFLQKEYMPEPSRGHIYAGVVIIPFNTFFTKFFFICPERGTTGVREATLLATGQIQMPKQDHIPHINSMQEMEEMYRKARESPPKLFGAEDEKFDSMFPDHPVTRARRYLRNLRETLSVDDAACNWPLFGT